MVDGCRKPRGVLRSSGSGVMGSTNDPGPCSPRWLLRALGGDGDGAARGGGDAGGGSRLSVTSGGNVTDHTAGREGEHWEGARISQGPRFRRTPMLRYGVVAALHLLPAERPCPHAIAMAPLGMVGAAARSPSPPFPDQEPHGVDHVAVITSTPTPILYKFCCFAVVVVFTSFVALTFALTLGCV